MYDSESEESDTPGCSDSEFGHPGQSTQDNQKQPGDKMYSHFVNLDINLVSPTGGNIKLKPPTKSAHQQGNRGGHVPPEKAEPYNGRKFIETPNLTSQSPHRNTPPTLSCQRSWVMGRGRGRTRVEETKISTEWWHFLWVNKLQLRCLSCPWRLNYEPDALPICRLRVPTPFKRLIVDPCMPLICNDFMMWFRSNTVLCIFVHLIEMKIMGTG